MWWACEAIAHLQTMAGEFIQQFAVLEFNVWGADQFDAIGSADG